MKKKILKTLILLPIVFILVINVAIFLGPSLIVGHNNEFTVYDNNNEEFSYHYYGMGKYVSLDDISPYMLKSIIASEDQSFYSHHGFDYKRIVASIIDNIRNREIVAGGSTITQQVARTLYLDNKKTILRKVKEAILARKLEMSYSKDKILEAYLNCVYFGHNIYGIDEASYFFFEKKPSELTLAESALLTGIISAPSYYSPDVDEIQSTRKKEQVLRIMLKRKDITSSEYDSAISEEIKYSFIKKSEQNSNILYYFDAIKQTLNEKGLLNSSTSSFGIDIKSTIDLKITEKINKIIKNSNINEQENQISVVIMRPNSGDVLCLIGGVDYNNSQFNRATSSYRQTGSTIKPLLYYLALEAGLDTKTELISKQTTFKLENIGEYSPSNATNTYANGPITMVEAVALSDNIYATKTLLLIGSETLANSLKKFGIKNVIQNPTIGLGTNEMTPLQLASIYNAFSSEGKYFSPNIIKEARLKNGEIIYRSSNSYKFSLNKKYVLAVNFMLTSPFDQALSSYTNPSLINYQTKNTFAAKTGSTLSDSWVVGFNKEYTILVHVGNDENDELKNGSLAKELFVEIADSLMENKLDNFYKPDLELKPFKIQRNGKNSKTYYSIY
ncbi:MAG: penicillin-binding protein [Erysipelotrichales bacterium]|nr:penicillin-binding protein [Erysipelotrichales bacterium]